MSVRRRLAIASVAVVLLAAGTAAAFLTLSRRDVTTSSREAHRLYEKGLENEQKMYMREAVEDYAAALAKDPHFVMATLRLANALQSHDPDRSRQLIESVARYKDDVTERERLILEMALAKAHRNPTEIGEKLQLYLERFPRDPEGYQIRASLLQHQGKTEEAHKVFEQLIAVNPNYATAYNNLGYYEMGKGDYARSEDYFKRYRFLAPDQANPFDSLGELYANTGRYEEARASLKQALAVKADFAPSVAHMGTILVGEGKLEEAAESYRAAAAIAENPENRSGWGFDAAAAYLFAKKPDEARSQLERVEESVRSLPESQQRSVLTHAAFIRAAISAMSGQAEETESKLGEALVFARAQEEAEQRDPHDKDYKPHWQGAPELIRGALHRAQGDCAGATAFYDVCLKLADEHDAKRDGGFDYFPVDTFVRLNAADCLAQLGRRDDAEKLLAKVLVRNPNFRPAVDLAARLGLKATPAAAVASR